MFFVIVRAHVIPAFFHRSKCPFPRDVKKGGHLLDDSNPAPAWQHSSGTRSISSLSALAFLSLVGDRRSSVFSA